MLFRRALLALLLTLAACGDTERVAVGPHPSPYAGGPAATPSAVTPALESGLAEARWWQTVAEQGWYTEAARIAGWYKAATRPRLAPVSPSKRPRASSPPTPAPERPAATGDVWAALARCESGMTNANTGNGFYGYFQFVPSTWRSLGYSGLPTDYSYETQRAAAQQLQARSGWGQWPACSRRLGLR